MLSARTQMLGTRWQRMTRFVGCDLGLVLHGQSNVVEAFEQAAASEIVDGESGGKSAPVGDAKLLEIHFHLIVRNLARPAHEFSYFLLAKDHGKHTIL